MSNRSWVRVAARWSVLSLMLLPVVGCASSEKDDEAAEGEGDGAEGEGEGEGASACERDPDCGPGKICLGNGTCVEGCRSETDCSAGQKCRENKCRSTCTVDTECPANYFCGQGVCRAGCATDTACAAGKICLQNQCVAGECNVQKTCPADEQCNAQHVCVEKVTSCAHDAECGAGKICLATACVAGTCSTETPCPDGQSCSAAHRCVQDVEECVDQDGDGYGLNCEDGPDCDDSKDGVNPGVTENAATLCDDGTDNDCNGSDAVCGDTDEDGDGVTVKDGDCDDTDAQVAPDKDEVPYNGKDDDCDVRTSDVDVDGDGHAGTQAEDGDDCNDGDPAVYPGARDVPGNGKDEDCDGVDAQPNVDDADGDGVTQADGDCDDSDAAVNPAATEVPYNGKDDDCKAATRDNDLDGDGVNSPQDCKDDDAAIKPGVPEIPYNGKDDDCDAATPDADVDHDGHGSVAGGGDDCNDENAAVHPGAEEVPYSGIDEDCDAATKDDDLDGDGFGRATDCDDENAAVNPEVAESPLENCGDGVDNDCAGGDVPCDGEWTDEDGDGFPAESSDPTLVDCDDSDPFVNPGTPEYSNNGVDDDCNAATVDECESDYFEGWWPNDSWEDATAVDDANSSSTVQYSDLMICYGDQDWFQIELQPGDGLQVETFFYSEVGDLDLEIIRIQGGEPVVISASRGIGDGEIAAVDSSPDGGTYYIHVFGWENASAPYAMTVNVFSGCRDDELEQNDWSVDAGPLATWTPIGGQICDHDDDWFTVDVAAAGALRVDLLFKDAEGDLDLFLFDEAGTQVAASTSSDDDERVTLNNAAAGTYHVRVTGYGASTAAYRLLATVGAQERTITKTESPEQAIPDRTDAGDGFLAHTMALNAPADAIAISLVVRDLDIDHTWLPDLLVALELEDGPLAFLWANQGNITDGTDAGLDDDWFLGTGRDINLDNRRYHEFDAAPIDGALVLSIFDGGFGDTGTLQDVSVEIKYLSR